MNSPQSKKMKNEMFIYQNISNAILEQRLAPGTKLTEESLGEIFGASRTVIRRVLTKLSYENVVEIRPNRGAVIASPTIEQARQIFESRQIIEQAAIRACVKKHSDDDLISLRQLIQAEKDCVEKGDRIGWIRLTGEFHIEIAKISGNEVLGRFLKDLVAQTSLIIALYGTSGNSLCCDDDHSLIVEAIAERDEDRAMKLMLCHLQECEDSLSMHCMRESDDLKTIFSNIG